MKNILGQINNILDTAKKKKKKISKHEEVAIESNGNTKGEKRPKKYTYTQLSEICK